MALSKRASRSLWAADLDLCRTRRRSLTSFCLLKNYCPSRRRLREYLRVWERRRIGIELDSNFLFTKWGLKSFVKSSLKRERSFLMTLAGKTWLKKFATIQRLLKAPQVRFLCFILRLAAAG